MQEQVVRTCNTPYRQIDPIPPQELPFFSQSANQEFFPHTHQAVLPLRNKARLLVEQVLNSTCLDYYRSKVQKFMFGDPAIHQHENFVVQLGSQAFEDMSYLFLQERIEPEEVLLPPRETSRLFEHPLINHLFKSYGSSRAVPDGLVVEPNGNKTYIPGVCEYTIRKSWAAKQKQKQIKHYNSAQVISDFLTSHPPEVQQTLGQYLHERNPAFPSQLAFEDDNYRTVFTLTRGKHYRGPTRLRRNPKVYLVPIEKEQLMDISWGLYADLYRQIHQKWDKSAESINLFLLQASLADHP